MAIASEIFAVEVEEGRIENQGFVRIIMSANIYSNDFLRTSNSCRGVPCVYVHMYWSP